MKLVNKKISNDEFFKIREIVLNSWRTGIEASSLEANYKYLKKIPPNKNMAYQLRKAKKEQVTLAQPRCGVTLIDDQIKLLNFLKNTGEADLLTATIDSYTRNNNYEKVEKVINGYQNNNRSLLNGFPAVNYGVKNCRTVFEAIDAPLQARHGSPDGRLLAEIIHASGWTANEGGGISYNIPYSKDVALEKSLKDWQYTDRLVGIYQEMGIELNREFFAPLTATIVPPCIINSVMIIEALLAAEQGVKNLSIGYSQGGNLVQDIAAMSALVELTNEYMDIFGYNDVDISTVFHQWMGLFPFDEAKAFGTICVGSTIAAFCGATKVIVKTPHEAHGIPTMEANAQGIKATKQTLNLLKGQSYPKSREINEEKDIIIQETKAIIDEVLKAGNGDLAVGVVNAFDSGLLDIPFAPSKYNRNKVLPARDNDGAIRILEFGNLPIPQDIKDYHKERLIERSLYEKRDLGFKMVLDDIYAVGNNQLIGRPKEI
ncbi:methylaspartate mutase subunit E [Bacillus cereus group sp. TH152-1LC]|uniref:methylaspartate mutase subunit E n=1 Tax=Bacillus cereus group sp. TH152-1LC TaxID=3018060 RepID=UPI0022DF4AE1|nr:methylaspartate mutase subunit E [Bacillus cereus group sp. TH152-1LC]MDA1677506.1 methylaspartate mutase subunit E [Bacillus cereus group sp. TH152-1LC]